MCRITCKHSTWMFIVTFLQCTFFGLTLCQDIDYEGDSTELTSTGGIFPASLSSLETVNWTPSEFYSIDAYVSPTVTVFENIKISSTSTSSLSSPISSELQYTMYISSSHNPEDKVDSIDPTPVMALSSSSKEVKESLSVHSIDLFSSYEKTPVLLESVFLSDSHSVISNVYTSTTVSDKNSILSSSKLEELAISKGKLLSHETIISSFDPTYSTTSLALKSSTIVPSIQLLPVSSFVEVSSILNIRSSNINWGDYSSTNGDIDNKLLMSSNIDNQVIRSRTHAAQEDSENYFNSDYTSFIFSDATRPSVSTSLVEYKTIYSTSISNQENFSEISEPQIHDIKKMSSVLENDLHIVTTRMLSEQTLAFNSIESSVSSNDDKLIEVMPSFISHRSSKEAILQTTSLDQKSSEVIDHTHDISSIVNEETGIPEVREVDSEEQSYEKELRSDESFNRNKTSREDNRRLDDIISGIIHLLAGDVKVVRPPPPIFPLPNSPVPVLRPTSTRINNRGPPTFISPSRTLVLLSQPEHQFSMAARPIQLPNNWHMRPANAVRPPILGHQPVALHGNFPITRTENPHGSAASVVHLYKPIIKQNFDVNHKGQVPADGDMFIAVAKPSPVSYTNGFTSDIKKGNNPISSNNFEVFSSTKNETLMEIKSPTLSIASKFPNANSQVDPSLNNPDSRKTLGDATRDWEPFLERPTVKARPNGERNDDRDVIIITQPTVFDLTVTNALAGLKNSNTKLQSSAVSSNPSLQQKASLGNRMSLYNVTAISVLQNYSKEMLKTLSSLNNMGSDGSLKTVNSLNLPLFGLLSSPSPVVRLQSSSVLSLPSSIALTPPLSTIQETMAKIPLTSSRALNSPGASSIYYRNTIVTQSPFFSSSVLKSSSRQVMQLLTPTKTRSPVVSSTTKYSTPTKPLLGRPIVVPVDIEEVRPYVGAINPPRQGPRNPNNAFPPPYSDVQNTYNKSNVQLAKAGVNVADTNRGSLSTTDANPQSPSKRPSLVRTPPRLKPNSPLVRIDTCIVGDESTCDANWNETCKSQMGISSCQCRAGYSRLFMRGPCQPVVSVMMSLKVDRFGNQRIFYNPRYVDINSEEYKLMEFEAKQALSSLFSYTSFSRHFLGVTVNRFYSIGGKLIVNATINLEDNNLIRSQSLRLRLRKEVVQAINNRNHNIGDSRLYVDGPLNPVPAVEDVDECSDAFLNDCSSNGVCRNVFGTFQCKCKPGYIDANPLDERASGRKCSACSIDYCHNHGQCYIEKGQRHCKCSGNYIGARCDIDSEVLGVALGASVAAIIIILLTLACLCVWNRRWKREEQRTDVMSARSVNSNQTFSYLNKLATANTYRLTMEDRMRWAHISDVVGNLYAKPDPSVNPNTPPTPSLYPGPSRCQSPLDETSSWYNCATRPRSRGAPYAHPTLNGSYYDMDYSTREIYMAPGNATSRRHMKQSVSRAYYS